MFNEYKSKMKTQNVTIEQLAEKFGTTVWTKGELKRIYLNDEGYNTKKMSTKTFIYEKDGEFKVSCKIECPSQPYQWISSQEDEVKESVYNRIEWFISETIYIRTDDNGNFVNADGFEKELGDIEQSDIILNKESYTGEWELKELPKSEWESANEILADKKAAKFQESYNKRVEIEKPIKNNTENITYSVGMKVKHNQFGIGEIMTAEGEKLRVLFECGEKILMACFAHLEIV
jgi:hypothetical protein